MTKIANDEEVRKSALAGAMAIDRMNNEERAAKQTVAANERARRQEQMLAENEKRKQEMLGIFGKREGA